MYLEVVGSWEEPGWLRKRGIRKERCPIQLKLEHGTCLQNQPRFQILASHLYFLLGSWKQLRNIPTVIQQLTATGRVCLTIFA